MNRFKNYSPFILLGLLSGMMGCAHGKIKAERTPLAAGAISKSTPILVKEAVVDNMAFSGDKAAELARTNEEKSIIRQTLSEGIIENLRKKGFSAKRYAESKDKNGVVLTSTVTKFEHGSAAARAFVGMGAGSSNLFVTVKLDDVAKKQSLADFDVIATSGGRGGLTAMGSFLKAHVDDAGEKTAEYIEKHLK